jgi:hypothetical protein
VSAVEACSGSTTRRGTSTEAGRSVPLKKGKGEDAQPGQVEPGLDDWPLATLKRRAEQHQLAEGGQARQGARRAEPIGAEFQELQP